MYRALQRLRAVFLDIGSVLPARFGKHLEITVCQGIPVFRKNLRMRKAAAASDGFQRRIQLIEQRGDCCVRIVVITQLAEYELSAARSLGSKQIRRFIGHILPEMRIADCQNAANLIPFVKRRLIQQIKELVHVENAGRLHNDAVKMLHSECDQLCPEPTPVTVRIIAPGNGFQLAVLAFQFLQQQHIHIDGAEIVFQHRNALAAGQTVFCISKQKGSLAGTQNAGDQVNFRQSESNSFRVIAVMPPCRSAYASSKSDLLH